MKPVSVIILAGGSSSRMGQSKQLLSWGDTTLLQHSIKIAIDSKVGHVFVVLGDNEDAHRKAISDLPVTIVSNPSWQKGMGSSLKAGLLAARENSEAVMIMVCDQPFVSSEHLNHLVEHYEKTQGPIVASKYGSVVGVPALFTAELFNELSLIGDEEGAKKLIEKRKGLVAVVYLKRGDDLDTYDDYLKASRPTPQ